MSLPSGFVEALETLGRAFNLYHQRTGGVAVLVGGAATAIYTAGAFMSSDFDILAGQTQAFEGSLTDLGFVREHEPGYLLGGFYHPNHPQYGFQIVSGPLFDGRADLSLILAFKVSGRSTVALPSIEDMIADRLAQHAIASSTDLSRLEQARSLFKLAADLKTDYLQRRILEEGGDPTLLGLPA